LGDGPRRVSLPSRSRTTTARTSAPNAARRRRRRHDHVEILLGELAARIGDELVGFGGESDEKPISLQRGNLLENVGVGTELDRARRGRLLDLPAAGAATAKSETPRP